MVISVSPLQLQPGKTYVCVDTSAPDASATSILYSSLQQLGAKQLLPRLDWHSLALSV